MDNKKIIQREHIIVIIIVVLFLLCGCVSILDPRTYVCHFELSEGTSGGLSKALTEPKQMSFEEYVGLKKKVLKSEVLRLVCD